MDSNLEPKSELKNCPKCTSELPPRLSTGRIVCRKCGWADKPKSVTFSGSTTKVNPLSYLKTRNGERVLIGLCSFAVASLVWLSTRPPSPTTPVASTPAPSPQAPSAPVTSAPESPSLSDRIKEQFTNSYTLNGSLTLIDSDISGIPSNCNGSGGYRDIRAGMSVTIRDATGKILAIGDSGYGAMPDDSGVVCKFSFQVINVPKSDFYTIEVGRRGGLNFSFEELQKQNWEISVSLG